MTRTRHTSGVLVSLWHVRRETAGHQYNDAQLTVELVDHFVTIEHVRRPLDVRVVLRRLYFNHSNTHSNCMHISASRPLLTKETLPKSTQQVLHC